MADLLLMAGALRLYCWPCKDVHTIELADVERIVYALGAEASQARSGQGHGESSMDCLTVMVDRATTGDCFQFVDLSIECREAEPGPTRAEMAARCVAVLQIHRPAPWPGGERDNPERTYCASCLDSDQQPIYYPCPTAQALGVTA